MSINSSSPSNFISNQEMLVWMQEKTDGIYGHMRGEMDTSNQRAHAEDALNDIKAKLLELKTNGGNTDDLRLTINATLEQYPDIPEVAKVLQPFATELNGRHELLLENQLKVAAYQAQKTANLSTSRSNAPPPHYDTSPVKLSSDQIENWTKDITAKVENLSKQDQLGLINLQEFNAQLNQAKQTASALMDAADKSANAIINHIS